MFSIPTPQKASKGESSASCLWITERPISMYQSETDQGPVFFKHSSVCTLQWFCLFDSAKFRCLGGIEKKNRQSWQRQLRQLTNNKALLSLKKIQAAEQLMNLKNLCVIL